MAAGDISQALLARVRSRFGTGATYGLTDDEVYHHLNRGQLDLMWRMNPALLDCYTASASGSLVSSRFAIPSDFWRERLLLVGGVKAKRLEITELGSLGPMNAAADQPYYYIWYNATDGAIKFHVEIGDAASTAAYVLYYLKSPAGITSSVDPLLPASLQDLLVEFAISRVYANQREYQAAGQAMERYLQRCTRLNTRYLTGEWHEGPPGVRL